MVIVAAIFLACNKNQKISNLGPLDLITSEPRNSICEVYTMEINR